MDETTLARQVTAMAREFEKKAKQNPQAAITEADFYRAEARQEAYEEFAERLWALL